ncbi:hypothetical protein [Paenibacillus turpanensis]|uniref:hypothetical protein n=1 Tax=Paenibacillus turpanensis TaxID=2689078 RepID=UPI00140A6980|nr:hypothetical protein [Paenibacillus turpanensis]
MHWESVWRLTKKDLKAGGLLALGVMVFLLIYGLFSTQNALEFLSLEDGNSGWRKHSSSVIMDFTFLCFVSVLGAAFYKDHFSSYWRTDIFTKQLQFIRRLPIDPKHIVQSRVLQILISTVLCAACFLLPFGVIVAFFSETPVYATDFILFTIFWMSYSIFFGMIYLMLELSMSGKKYAIFGSLLYVPVFITDIVMIFGFKKSFVIETLFFGRSVPGTIMGSGLVILALACAAAAYKKTITIVKNRDLSA